ncbi:MAG: diguanylate cyclase domain-containing protein [Rhizobacter sp.]
MNNTHDKSGRAVWCLWLLLLMLCGTAAAHAPPLDLDGRWLEETDTGTAEPVEQVALTGGRFRFEAEFHVPRADTWVIDFKNSSVVHRFTHELRDDGGRLVATLSGGIGSEGEQPFMLRHGREVVLEPGRYRLVTRLSSPFFLAQPEPYLDTLASYRQAIKAGNAIVLVCLGIFLGLGVYYTCLAALHGQRVHAAYAVFIAGNLLYNGTALLAFRDLFGWQTFYLISAPILFSNIAYLVFVMALLDIRRDSATGLWWAGRTVIAIMAGFIAVAAWRPNWSLELDRVGVALFLGYGLTTGVVQAWRGSVLARPYLLANVGFFVSGLSSIALVDLQGVYAIYIEHLGLVAVTIEVVLLAFVLSYQFGLLRRDKDAALERAEGNLRLACTDALTGLPNRYALEMELAVLPPAGSLTFVDLDGLKHYNDHHGHASGDELLRAFAVGFSARLQGCGVLHRLGGDEFAATTHHGDTAAVERLLSETIEALRSSGYPLSGASCGSVRVFECGHHDQLKHVADSRMYENKRQRRRTRDSASVEADAA